MADTFHTYVLPGIIMVLEILAIVVPLMLCIAYLTLFERKVMAAMQMRRGPNIVGPFGLLQPLADGLKLFLKETVVPTGASRAVFFLAPILTFFLALVAWAVIPFSPHMVLSNINLGVLYIFATSSLGVYGIIMAGWSSNSRYAFLGGMRSAAQMVSYEVAMGLILISLLLTVGSLNLTDIIVWQQKHHWLFIFHLPMAVMYFVSAVAETNRHPFDLPEAEAELVSGYNVEYSAMGFGLFFLGEYGNMILMSTMVSVLFFGGWLAPFDITGPSFFWLLVKVLAFLFLYVWLRAAFPRYRYDQLMRLGWKVFLPGSLAWLVLTAIVLELTGNLPG